MDHLALLVLPDLQEEKYSNINISSLLQERSWNIFTLQSAFLHFTGDSRSTRSERRQGKRFISAICTVNSKKNIGTLHENKQEQLQLLSSYKVYQARGSQILGLCSCTAVQFRPQKSLCHRSLQELLDHQMQNSPRASMIHVYFRVGFRAFPCIQTPARDSVVSVRFWAIFLFLQMVV